MFEALKHFFFFENMHRYVKKDETKHNVKYFVINKKSVFLIIKNDVSYTSNTASNVCFKII